MKIKRNGKSLLVISLMLLVLISGCTEEEATIACAPDEEECATETEEGFAIGPAAGIAAGAAAVLALAGGLSGGGDDSSSGGSANSSYKAESVAISDFNVVSTYTVTEEEIRSWINNNSVFYNRMPSSGGSSARNDCIDNMEDTYGSIRSRGGVNYRFEFEMDIKDCNSDASEIKSEIISTLADLTAKKNGIYLNLEGIKYSQFQSNTLQDSDTVLRRFYREKIWNNNNKVIVYAYFAKSSDPNAPCEWSQSGYNDCESNLKWIYYYNNDLTTVTGIETRKYKSNNIVYGNGIYYQSGSKEFRKDDWAGTITFRGSSTPSTYIVYNNDMTITGTLDTSQISNQIDLDQLHFTHQQVRR